MGKSALALSFVTTAARKGYEVLLVSLEMSGLELTNRMIQGACNVNADRFRLGTLNPKEQAEVESVRESLEKLPIRIIDNGIRTVDDWYIAVKALHAQKKYTYRRNSLIS